MLKTYETFFYMYILKYFNTNMDYIFYENLEMIALLREESPSFIISKIICEAWKHFDISEGIYLC